MKICSSCKVEKEYSEFRKDKNRPDGHQPRCKQCVSDRYKELYHERYKVKVAERSRTHYYEMKEKIYDFLRDKCCINCGESNPIVLDFHHLDPSQKEFTVTQSLNRKWSSIESEMKKCAILCSNCHRRVHWDGLDITHLIKEG